MYRIHLSFAVLGTVAAVIGCSQSHDHESVPIQTPVNPVKASSADTFAPVEDIVADADLSIESPETPQLPEDPEIIPPPDIQIHPEGFPDFGFSIDGDDEHAPRMPALPGLDESEGQPVLPAFDPSKMAPHPKLPQAIQESELPSMPTPLGLPSIEAAE